MKRARTSSKTFQGVKNGPFASTFQRLLRIFNKQGVEKTYHLSGQSYGRFKWEAYCWYSCYGSQYSMQNQNLEMFIVPWWTL